MKLYYDALSGHAHRIRLFLSLLDEPVEIVNVSLAAGEHKKSEFLKLNRFGQLPVLDDDGTIVADSAAILVYLAKKLGKTGWLPEDALGAAKVHRWLSVASGEIAYGPSAARLIVLFGAKLDAEEVIKRSHDILKLIDAELDGRQWIATAQPSIADVALYSYITAAPEGNVDISGYANVNAWLKRVEALPGFVPFARNAVGLRAAA
ncbi:glutathione S-transferase family protein [Burkholderia sp. Ac-20379]|uniref:glutathione S-transferase family protein n=1 Tax=Burkholderia sp. Ac-20379 TaxID=2703900 RepID=UPI00197D878C|nr:glutathione S-transferase [Burkholderia sp. Ac-20379]MBN3725450.1 glutathione S-transferase [Burkholderia sp. Ac-20379]